MEGIGQKQKIASWAIYVGVTVFFIYFLAILVLALIIFGLEMFDSNVFGENDLESEEKTYDYLSLTVNPQTNEHTYGMVSIFNELGPDEYIFTKNNDGSQLNLISSGNTEEYQCSGTCFCDTSNRRTASATLPRTLFYLVAAAGSAIAYSRATEYFEEECKDVLSGECPNSAVLSEVDSCNFVMVDGEKEGVHEAEGGEGQKYKYTYLCEGRCHFQENPYFVLAARFYEVRDDPRSKALKDSYDYLMSKRSMCERLKVSHKMESVATSMRYARPDVVKRFLDEHLNPFCEVQGTLEKVDITNHLEMSQKWKGGELTSWCTGDQTHFDSGPKIKCTKTKMEEV